MATPFFIPPLSENIRHADEEAKMNPRPITIDEQYQPSNKLKGKVAIITGGDSGIGRAVAILFAKEGANVTIVSLEADNPDVEDTCQQIETIGGQVLSLIGDIGHPEFCQEIVDQTLKTFGQIDCLVNNAAEQHPQSDIGQISQHQLLRTFQTNIFSFFYLTQKTLPHLAAGSTIINTTSVTAYKGSGGLLDYASTKGAIVAFTRSLSENLADKKIRVNAVAPGPIWTPLIPSTFPQEKVATFGQDVPLKRTGEPIEVAYCYLFLATEQSSYMSGQVLHPNGGEIVNG